MWTSIPLSSKRKRHTVVAEILQDVEAMFASFAYYFKSGDPTLNQRCNLPAAPRVARCRHLGRHSITTTFCTSCWAPCVHVADHPAQCTRLQQRNASRRSHRIRSREDVSEDTKALRLPRLAKRLSEEIAPGRSVFLCVHKHSEALAETFSTDNLKLNVGHWGAIDGKNNLAGL